MSVVKINALTVPEGMEAELEERFGDRRRGVENMDGFEGFYLLRPVSGDERYFVFTKWRSEEDFQNWVRSDEFRRGHARSARAGGSVAIHAHLLSFEVVDWSGTDGITER